MKIIVFSVALIMISGATQAIAGDPVAGKAKSASCNACHGENGISTSPTVPNLAGQKEAYLVAATKAYKTGARKDGMMGALVGGLSDADIADISAYYAGLK